MVSYIESTAPVSCTFWGLGSDPVAIIGADVQEVVPIGPPQIVVRGRCGVYEEGMSKVGVVGLGMVV